MKQIIEKINPATIYKIVTSYGQKVIDGYQEIEKVLTSSDDEDGGGHYDLIIQNVETQKYYKIEYCDWDIDNTDFDEEDEEDEEDGENEGSIGDRCDLPDTMVEVYPKQVTVTQYYPVEI